MLAVVFFIALTAFCWGIYGPVLHNGQHDMGADVNGVHVRSLLRPFVCVGMAYFIIAVVAAGAWLKLRGEPGTWTTKGLFWSLAAGAAGALVALGIILAFKCQGEPIFVMPLVFGSAPVVNTFVTMFMAKTTKQAGPIFFAGLILVVAGAVTVLVFQPAPARHGPAQAAAKVAKAGPTSAAAAAPKVTEKVVNWLGVVLSIALTGASWGAYGPVLHKGQMAMQGSRLRPLICVGLAYFLIAVLVPLGLLAAWGEQGEWNVSGTIWSLAGGAAGAIGALGIILAFTSGGKPIYVMPLVFGGAPVVSTFAAMIATRIKTGAFSEVNPVFYAGLIIVIAGAVTVLVFSPKGKPHVAPKGTPATPEPART